MIIIDTATVAVETEVELRSVLSSANTYTTIHLVNDMTLSQGVTILASKTNIIIDGTYPTDGTGTVQTYTDMNSSNSSDTISVQTSGTLSITLQNMNIIGRNYYGIIYVNDSVSGITTNYSNVTYTGPQFIYNALGYVTFIDVTFNSVASTASPLNEVAEVSNLTIGGNTTINHQANSGANAMFWFRSGTNPTLIINENANVVFNTTSYSFYTDIHPNITIGMGASVSFYTMLGMFSNSGHYASSLTVEDNSSLTIMPNVAATSSYSPPLVLAGNLTIGNNTNVFIQSTLSSMSPIYFRAAASITITNPKSCVFYANNAQAINTNGNTINFNISAEQINLWAQASATNPGDINDTPSFEWYRYNDPISTDYIPLSISGTSTSAQVWNVTSNNFTTQEVSNLPTLTNFLPGTDQVLSLGALITLNTVVDGQYPISGTTVSNANIQIEYLSGTTPYIDIGTSDLSGYFSIEPSATIEIDTSVTIISHAPFLTGTITIVAVSAGDITLEVPDEDLPFYMVALNVPSTILYGRDSEWKQLIVNDTRIYPTPWQISATIDSDMTSSVNSEHNLPNALIFIDTNEQVYSLGSEPVIVFKSDGTTSGETVVDWDDTKGILLCGDNVTFFANEKYSANINWSLDLL